MIYPASLKFSDNPAYYKNVLFVLLFLCVFTFRERKSSVNQGFLQWDAKLGTKERGSGNRS